MSHAGTDWNHRSKWLWAKTEGHCAYCGVVFASPAEMTTDHLAPRSSGGGDERENRFPCCRGCNATKGSRTLSYLREQLQRRRYGRPPFSSEQITYLAKHGIALPPEEPFQFYWELLGKSFPEGIE